ncbi:hypothetical protein EBZ38_14510 [bacterium]|nr:hypothetical protein [bacterium]
MFLEDAVELQHRYPNFPAYRHPVFLLPQWARYASQERVNIEVRKRAYTGSAADIQAQLQAAADAHAEALQGLHSKLDAVISGPPPAAGEVAPQDQSLPPGPELAPEATGSQRVVSILPPTIEDITQFYWVWCTEFRAQYRANGSGRQQWKHLDKHTARLASQRWVQLSVLMDFLDNIQVQTSRPVGTDAVGSGSGSGSGSVEPVGTDAVGSGSGGVEPSREALDALGVMVSFATEVGVSHTVLAKKVVGEMTKGLEIGPEYKGLGAKLRAKLESAGFIVPVCTKQDHKRVV